MSNERRGVGELIQMSSRWEERFKKRMLEIC